MPQLPQRPLPSRPVSGRLGASGRVVHDIVGELVGRLVARCRWVGFPRLVGGSVVVLAVVAGGYWLIRPPGLPAEASLPFSSTTTSSTVAVVPASSSDAAAMPVLVVHVAGAVRAPGVYELSVDARVVDAVAAAGGLAVDAAGDAVNLAARLADGQRVYIPRVGEEVPPEQSTGGNGDVDAPSALLDLNSATAAELEALPGIGPTTAAAIVAHRDLHGPFATVDDLADVSGIGPSKLEAIRPLVTV